MKYEDILTGIPGRVISETDGKGNDIPFSSEEYYAPQNGRDLVLTIDSSIQYFAEKYLIGTLTSLLISLIATIIIEKLL